MDRNDKKKLAKKMGVVLLNDEIYAGAAQLAYALIMAVIPMIMFIITLAGQLMLPVEDIYHTIQIILPEQAYSIVKGILDEIVNSSNFSIVTLILTIYFISIGTRGLMRVMNKAYHSVEKRSFLRFFSTSFVFAFVLVIAFIVTLGAVVFGNVILLTLNEWFESLFNVTILASLTYLRYIGTFLLLGLIFCLVYLIAPNLKLRLRDVYVGGYTAALLWIIGSAMFGFYINNFANYGLLFGSLGGLFILLLWLYITSLILIFGSNLNALIYYHKYESFPEEKEG